MSINYVSVPFKGAYYMCVEGSDRAITLAKANRAWTMGYDVLANDLLSTAMMQDGCAFDDREEQPEVGRRDEDGYFFDSQAYYNLYN